MPDKTVIIKVLTANDFSRINIENVNGTLTLNGTYQMKDSLGKNIDNPKIITKTLTVAQKAVLVDFIVNNLQLVIAANIQEGM